MIKEFKKLNYKFDVDINVDLKNIPGKKLFTFIFWDGDKKYTGEGKTGDTSFWFPLNEKRGIKYIPYYKQYDSMLENVKYLASIKSDILPDINGVYEDNDTMFIDMENVIEWPSGDNISDTSDGEISFVPVNDKEFVKDAIYLSPKFTKKCLRFFIDNKIIPNYDWYKSRLDASLNGLTGNVINNKIVDFHQFLHSEKNYLLPSNKKTKSDIDKIFKDGLERYKKWIKIDSSGLPKWKGKFYHQFEFDNGYKISGYSSDTNYADCVQKLQFMPLLKVKNKKVLDLGCCQGFFSFQCALVGAKKVIGIDKTEEDIMVAKDINTILKFDNLEFHVTDAVEYVNKTTEKFELVILSSVLHQIYNNMKGADNFLSDISKKTNTLCYETALDHPLMDISIMDVFYKLKKYFRTVRLMYVYDAYSSGYRGIFLCQHS